MGKSPIHSRNVALVLDIEKGYVSPQFHVKIDSSFHSVKGSTRQEIIKSQWQVKTGFVADQNKKVMMKTNKGIKKGKTNVTEQTSQNPTIPESEIRQQVSKDMLQPTKKTTIDEDYLPSEPEVKAKDFIPRRSTRETRVPERLIDIMGFEMRAEVESRTQGRDVPGEIFCIDVCHP